MVVTKSADNTHFNYLGVIVDYIDECMPDLTSPYIAFMDETTVKPMVLEA
jgi:hypothetical protein